MDESLLLGLSSTYNFLKINSSILGLGGACDSLEVLLLRDLVLGVATSFSSAGTAGEISEIGNLNDVNFRIKEYIVFNEKMCTEKASNLRDEPTKRDDEQPTEGGDEHKRGEATKRGERDEPTKKESLGFIKEPIHILRFFHCYINYNCLFNPLTFKNKI